MINMELESIKFINNQKKTGEYDKLREMDKNASKGKKMEVLKIKSVSNNIFIHIIDSLKI